MFRTTGALPECLSRYNIAPSVDVLAVRYNPEDQQRHLSLLHWGLIPVWVKDRSIAYRMINARAEGISDKPSFRDAFAKRRCIVPVDGFYEWKRGGARLKRPFAIMPTDGFPFAFAGLWERWRDPTTKEIIRSCTIITCPSNAVLAPLHASSGRVTGMRLWPKWLGQEPRQVMSWRGERDLRAK